MLCYTICYIRKKIRLNDRDPAYYYDLIILCETALNTAGYYLLVIIDFKSS